MTRKQSILAVIVVFMFISQFMVWGMIDHDVYRMWAIIYAILYIIIGTYFYKIGKK